jgi:hypothetical protein
MPWFKIDDKAAFNRKLVGAGNEAVGAWARAGAWSSGEGTDGHVPEHIALLIAPAKVWKRLVAARLVDVTPDGYALHDFLAYNPSAADVAANREAERQRKAEWRAKTVRAGDGRYRSGAPATPPERPDRGVSPASCPGGTGGGTTPSVPHRVPPSVPPLPTQPNPTQPNPTQGDREHTQRVRAAVPADPAARDILAALRDYKALTEVATMQAAEMVAGRLLACPKPMPHVLQAIADLARDAAAADAAGSPWGPEHMAKMLARYTDRARPPHDDRDRRRVARGAVQPADDRQWTPPEGAGF